MNINAKSRSRFVGFYITVYVIHFTYCTHIFFKFLYFNRHKISNTYFFFHFMPGWQKPIYVLHHSHLRTAIVAKNDLPKYIDISSMALVNRNIVYR